MRYLPTAAKDSITAFREISYIELYPLFIIFKFYKFIYRTFYGCYCSTSTVHNTLLSGLSKPHLFHKIGTFQLTDEIVRSPCVYKDVCFMIAQPGREIHEKGSAIFMKSFQIIAKELLFRSIMICYKWGEEWSMLANISASRDDLKEL